MAYAQPTFVPNQILVEYQNGAAPLQIQKVLNQVPSPTQTQLQQVQIQNALKLKAQIDSLNQKIGALSLKPISITSNLQTHYLMKLKSGTNLNQVMQTMSQQPNLIKATQPNYYLHTLSVIPNDPYFSTFQWNLRKIDMPDAWGLTEGSSSVTIAVIDSGIDYNNPDFANTDIVKGENFITGTMDPMDDLGHGTHVAGIIAASSNNNIGISGIDWHAKLLAIKVTDSNGIATTANVIGGIQQAVADGAKVINLSLGDGSNTTPDPCSQNQVLQGVINTAAQQGVLIVTSAGNGIYNQTTGQEVDSNSSNVTPASCNNVLTVGATDQNDNRASYSDYGSDVVISAPGGDISATHNAASGILSLKSANCNPNSDMCQPNLVYNTNYLFAQGTSMAAPHVSAVAALLWSYNPGLSIQQVRNCLVNNADPIQTSPQYPIGPRLNAYKALLACAPSPTITNPTLTPIPTTAISSNSVYLNLKILLDGIGSAGDSANPNASTFSNKHPITPTRNLNVTILQGANVVNTTVCLIHYDPNSGSFISYPQAPCDIGNIPAGNFEIKVKTDRYLQKIAVSSLALTDGQVATLPSVTLIAGDINGDNTIDLTDYNILLSCYNDFGPPKCSGINLINADLDDDGQINYSDLNLFLREPHIAGQ